MFRKVLPHLCIAASVMILVFYIINLVNDAMGFLRGDVFETFLLVYALISLTTAIILVVINEKHRHHKK